MQIKRKRIVAIVAAAVLVTAIGVVAASELLNQIAPAIPATQIVMNGCNVLTRNAAFGADRVFVGQTGVTGFDCGRGFLGIGRVSAFSTDSGGPAVPHFTLPTGYTALWIQRTGNFGFLDCTSLGSNSIQIFNSVAVDPVNGGLAAGASYSYCAPYANVPTGGLAGFNVTWTDS